MTYTAPSYHDIQARRSMLAPFDQWNERVFSAIIAWAGLPRTYLDLGSGTGAMVNFARKMGVDAYGLDVINGPEHWFIHHDLTQPFVWNPAASFDLITCIEVAEHLDDDDALFQTVEHNLADGGVFIFSSAPPGQAGEHHVNCQPAYYWRDRFKARGISYREDYTRELSHLMALSYVTGPMMWISANIQVFDC